MKVYKIKKLIPGSLVDPGFKGKTLIAIPDVLERPVVVKHENGEMVVDSEQPLKELKFPDRFGRNKEYVLRYYEWRPTEQISFI